MSRPLEGSGLVVHAGLVWFRLTSCFVPLDLGGVEGGADHGAHSGCTCPRKEAGSPLPDWLQWLHSLQGVWQTLGPQGSIFLRRWKEGCLGLPAACREEAELHSAVFCW